MTEDLVPSNPVYTLDQIRDMLDREIVVLQTRDPDVNRKREEAKQATIRWVIMELQHGIDLDHRRKPPEFTYTFGDTWTYVRRAVMMYHPNCQLCGRPAQEVHHIRPRFLKGENVPSNLIALCCQCHDQIHRELNNKIDQIIEESVKEAK